MEKKFAPIIVICCLLGVGVVLIGLGIGLYKTSTELNSSRRAPVKTTNVVLIVMDAFRADRVGQVRNGVPLTPFLDSLGGEAAVFRSAVSNCTWTRPSMTSLLTSLYVDAHQVIYGALVKEDPDAFNALAPEIPTIATVLKAYGYNTLAIQTNGNLFPELGFSKGFDVYRTSLDADATQVTDWALEEWNRARTPFFLYAHYMDPHLPYEPPQQHRDMVGYAPETLSNEERAVVENFRDYYRAHCEFMTGQTPNSPFAPLSDAGKEAVKLLYDASIRYTDDHVGRLVKTIREKAPDTLFIITADHGEHFWDHEFLGHGLTLYNCELRVPLFFLGAGVPPGEYDHVVELVDVLPSVAGLLGLPREHNWQGADAFRSEDKPVYAKTKSSNPRWNTDWEMVISEGKKLVLNHKDGTAHLFTFPQDGLESEDLGKEDPTTVGRLRELLRQHHLKNLQARRAKGKQAEMDTATLEQLRNLGYMN